jgi:AraC family transcriptional regulator
MTVTLASKYGTALTGSDWVGLPLRIGHVPENGSIEDLSTDTDAVLVWSGGPSEVTIRYDQPGSGALAKHCFERTSGMMDLLPRGTKLQRVEWSGKPSVCVSVNFPQSSMEALCSTSGTGLVAERGPQFGLVDGHVVDLVSRLRAQAEGPEYLGAVYVQSLSLTLASYVAARYGAAGASREVERKSARLSSVQRHHIEQFIDHELASNFGLVDLASQVGYSPDHFSRLFKQAFNQSPYQYVLARRIERAKAMLRDESLPIAQIAAACGFSNQGHLTTAFKHRTGLTPGAYRKS